MKTRLNYQSQPSIRFLWHNICSVSRDLNAYLPTYLPCNCVPPSPWTSKTDLPSPATARTKLKLEEAGAAAYMRRTLPWKSLVPEARIPTLAGDCDRTSKPSSCAIITTVVLRLSCPPHVDNQLAAKTLLQQYTDTHAGTLLTWISKPPEPISTPPSTTCPPDSTNSVPR